MKIVFLLVFAILLSTFVQKVNAQETGCQNRFLTLVNPVRGRDLWPDKDLSAINKQYQVIQKNNFPATWLIQYDVLLDYDLLTQIKSFNSLQEKGTFLEVSKRLADDARVMYPIKTPWFYPNAVFLSGYSQSERKKLIDILFNKFKQQFGFYPKSVGAWWIDSYSLDYMKQKYQIKAAMIVADQQTTDNYGVWGQWWGVPYYPSKANILVPASNLENKQGVVVLQWAQRDPLRAYGEGPAISNFSLQANDYIRQGKTTEYFKEVSDSYLSCDNKLGQITVGLETGIESRGYIGEYASQLEYLKSKPGLKALTMSEFAAEFAKVYPQLPLKNTISYSGSSWHLTVQNRENKKLNDYISYRQNNSFSDYFIADKSEFLNRKLNTLEEGESGAYFPYYLVIFVLAGAFFYLRKQFLFYILGCLFLLNSFGLLFRSTSKFGWNVYYGAVVENLTLAQMLVCLVTLIILFLLLKSQQSRLLKSKLFLILLPLSFGLDFFLSKLRFSILNNEYYFGTALDTFRFLGISLSKNLNIRFINQDFEGYQLNAFFKFDYEKIWQNQFIGLIVFPLIHIIVAYILFFLFRKLPSKIRIILLSLLIILWIGYIYQVFTAEARAVLPDKGGFVTIDW